MRSRMCANKYERTECRPGLAGRQLLRVAILPVRPCNQATLPAALHVTSPVRRRLDKDLRRAKGNPCSRIAWVVVVQDSSNCTGSPSRVIPSFEVGMEI